MRWGQSNDKKLPIQNSWWWSVKWNRLTVCFSPSQDTKKIRCNQKYLLSLTHNEPKKLHGSSSWQWSLMANDWITRSRWECNKRPTKYCHSRNNKGFLMRKMILAEGMTVVSWYMLIPCFIVSSHYLNGQGRIFPFTFFSTLALMNNLVCSPSLNISYKSRVRAFVWSLWRVLKYFLVGLLFLQIGCQTQHQISARNLSPGNLPGAKEILLFFFSSGSCLHWFLPN